MLQCLALSFLNTVSAGLEITDHVKVKSDGNHKTAAEMRAFSIFVQIFHPYASQLRWWFPGASVDLSGVLPGLG